MTTAYTYLICETLLQFYMTKLTGKTFA